MAMRFDLEERRSDAARFRRVAAPKFGRWDRSKAGVAGFVYTKRVTRLAQGRWYRAIVRFRWSDAQGRVQRTARRATPACHQPDQRAEPRSSSRSARRARRAGPARYLVTIVNAGHDRRAGVDGRRSSPDGRATAVARRSPPLAPGERTTVVVDADPLRAGDRLVVAKLDGVRVGRRVARGRQPGRVRLPERLRTALARPIDSEAL